MALRVVPAKELRDEELVLPEEAIDVLPDILAELVL